MRVISRIRWQETVLISCRCVRGTPAIQLVKIAMYPTSLNF